MKPYEEDIELLDSIPGIGKRHAEQLLAEIGIGLEISKQFPSAPHLCSWAGMVPGNNESAGKKKSEKTRKGCSIQALLKKFNLKGSSFLLPKYAIAVCYFQDSLKLPSDFC